MKQKKRVTWAGAGRAIGIASVLGVLGACGGGGGSSDGGGGGSVSVSSATAGASTYSQFLVLTVNGSGVNQGLNVSATGCKTPLLSTTTPYVSSATTAYYRCTVSAVGAGQFVVTRSSDAVVLATVPFTVPVPQVTMTLSNGAGVNGTIVFTLAPDKTPTTVDNFLAYVNTGFYDGTVIHRVSPGFVIQGGGYASPLAEANATPKPTNAPIALEVNKGLSNTQWTVAMARTSDANSATSQFFINLVDNSSLLDPSSVSPGYAVFGNVSAGTATVTSVVGAPCTAIPFFLASGECTPIPNVVVTSAVQSQ